MKTRMWAELPGSPTKGEDRIKITSRWSACQVYVCRLVKTSNRWGKRRWLIDESEIRSEQVQEGGGQ